MEELTLFKSAFNTFSGNRPEITQDDLNQLMKRVGEGHTEAEINLFFQYIGKPTINFDQFIKFVASKPPTPKTQLESMFELLDHDKNGAITLADLQRTFQNLSEDISPDLLSAMISAIDASGKGEISFRAFKRAFSLNG